VLQLAGLGDRLLLALACSSDGALVLGGVAGSDGGAGLLDLA
jgi:hypothetical protein